MAYIPDNLSMISDNVGGLKPRIFTYYNTGIPTTFPPTGTEAPDPLATIVTAGYFADGVLKGMRLGDLVNVVNDVVGAVHFSMLQVTVIVVNPPPAAPTVTVAVATAVP
jgi:hypothetical protein